MSRLTSLNIMELFAELKKSTDEHTAMTISSAFERLVYDQEERVGGTKKILLEEIDQRDFATKPDLKELELLIRRDMKTLEVGLRKEIEESRLSAQKDIEGIRLSMKELEVSLQKDIEGVRLSMKELEVALLKDRQKLEISLIDKMDIAKWQVICSIGAMIFVSFVARHFGF